MLNMINHLIKVLLIWVLVLPHCASAKVSFSGFGTIAGYSGDSKELGFRPDIASKNESFKQDFEFADISKVGFQLNYSLNSKFEFLSQVVFKDEIIINDFDRVKFATIAYKPDTNWLLRAGRMAPPIYLLSDSRYVGYAHDTVYPIHDFYAQIPLSYFDGLDLTYTKRFNDFLVKLNAYYGDSTILVEAYDDILEGDLDYLGGSAIELNWKNWLVRLSYTRAKLIDFGVDIDDRDFLRSLQQPILPGVPAWDAAGRYANELEIGSKSFAYSSLAVEYTSYDYIITSELSELDSNTAYIPSTTAGYIKLSVPSAGFTPFIFVSSIKTDDKFSASDAPPELLSQYVEQAFNVNLPKLIDEFNEFLFIGYNHSSIGFGTRYQLIDNLVLKAQFEHKWVEENGGSLFISEIVVENPSEQLNVISFSVDWVF